MIPPVNQRIVIVGDHPHAGKAATVIGHEELKILHVMAAKCKADDGDEFFVTKASHWAELPRTSATKGRKKKR